MQTQICVCDGGIELIHIFVPDYNIFSVIIQKAIGRQNELKNMEEKLQVPKDTQYYLNASGAHLE